MSEHSVGALHHRRVAQTLLWFENSSVSATLSKTNMSYNVEQDRTAWLITPNS